MWKALEALLRAEGARIRDAAPGTIAAEEKTGPQDLVTNYDRQVQENLERGLRQLRPGAGFLGEEGLRVPPAGHTGEFFIIDPIDGTMNFARDYRRSCISVALADETGVRFGAVYDPYQDEYFCAERGRGALRNGRPLRVSDRPLDRAIVMFGTAPYDRGAADRTFALARRFFDRGLDLRRSGSAALDLCAVAAGRAEVFYETMLSPWDYAAAGVILEEAGGVIRQFSGAPVLLRERCSVLAACAASWDEAKTILREEPV